MKKNLIILALASLGLASCNGGFKQADGGLLYEINTDKGGPTIQTGDFISANLVIKNDGDSILMSTYDQGHPVQTVIPKSQFTGDIFSGLTLLSEGDSATIKVNADSMFKKQPKPPGFKGKYLIYVIKVNKVIAKGKLSDQVFNGRIEAFEKTQSDALKKAEPGIIKKYIADNKLKVTTTADSLNYIITTPGTGPTPAVGDTMVVNYTGKFLTNGKTFDTSIKDEAVKAKMPMDPSRKYVPIHIPVGEKRVIAGWDEGLMLLNKGAKATLIIPSSIAYGERGMSIIGPYTPIMFDIEVVDIIKPNPNAPKPVMPPQMKMPTQAQIKK
jgi:FKBP-type peptidyl-prolyl cis-trans isomerase FkpA